MATNVVMPKMGESITEGTILRWLKQPGDQIKKDEPILEISTDKVDTEVPAPSAGTLLQQLVQEKQTVAVGTPIAVIGEAGEKAEAPKAQEVKPEESKKKKLRSKTLQHLKLQLQLLKPQAANKLSSCRRWVRALPKVRSYVG